MKTKVVYALVSNENDFYLEQALLSVYSLRIYNLDTIVELVVDESTATTIEGKRAKIKEYVNKIHVVETPEGMSSVHRSRYLKTNLREFVQGDYLFIDCDTIISGSLEDIDRLDVEIAMVADVNGNLLLDNKEVIERCHQAGFHDVQGKPYFNSGVIYSRDTHHTHLLYERWYQLWQQSVTYGVFYDQPALCQANVDSKMPIKELPGIWNCQFKYPNGYKLLKDALILHYYSNNGQGKRPYVQDRIFEYIKEKGNINHVVENMVRHPKTTLYTVLTINDDKAFEYFNSDLIYTYFNVPKAYKIATFIAKVIETIIIRLINVHL